MFKRDTISLKEFSEPTQEGMKELCLHYDLWDLDDCFDPSVWAQLYFIMRQAPDRSELFPKGQWATIQELERRLDEWAKGRL